MFFYYLILKPYRASEKRPPLRARLFYHVERDRWVVVYLPHSLKLHPSHPRQLKKQDRPDLSCCMGAAVAFVYDVDLYVTVPSSHTLCPVCLRPSVSEICIMSLN